jgi:hypothetical protein
MTIFRPATSTMNTTPPQSGHFIPPPVTQIDDTGLSLLWLQDLALKIFYFQGYMSGFKMAEELALPFAGIVDPYPRIFETREVRRVKSSQQMGLEGGPTSTRLLAPVFFAVKPWTAASMLDRRRFH